MTQNGGANHLGAIIGINPATNAESLLWSFGSGTDGQSPTGDLVYCPLNGLLYGLTVSGGANQEGAVISFNPANDSEAVAWSLGHSSTGVQSPYGDLVYDAGTQLFYGMSFGGGINNTGTVFSFNPATDSVKEIWHFGYDSALALPYGNLVPDPNNGLYYGMTNEGGNHNDGAILTFNPRTDTVGKVFSFNDAPGGEAPYASLVFYPANGLFYGVTTAGGTDSMGVLFSYNPLDSVETPLYNFGSGNDASQPQCNLIYDQSKGVFYGLSIMGGTNNNGTIFSFDPSNNVEAVVANFGNGSDDGQFPNGSLIYDPATQLYYGMAQGGGSHTFGTVFSFNPSNNAENTLWSLGGGTDGAAPEGSLLLYTGATTGISPVSNTSSIKLYPNPGNGNFVLQSQNAIGAQYNICNTIGEVISQGTIQSDHQNISIDNAAAGMYLLMLNGQQGAVSLKFVVDK